MNAHTITTCLNDELGMTTGIIALKRVQQIRRLRERGGDVGEQGVSAELLPAVAATGPMPQVSTVHLSPPLRVSTP